MKGRADVQHETEDLPVVVARIFTADVLKTLAGVTRPPALRADHLAEPIRKRHIMFSGGPVKGNAFRALRRTWWRYVEHADGGGMFDEDLLQRLTSADDDLFRGALAECQTCWFFAEKLGITLRRHAGRGGDFQSGEGMRIEVKAPYVAVPGDSWWGDDADVLAKCIKKAAEQLVDATMNIVVVCPLLKTPVWMQREQLLSAAIGEWAISVPVALDGSEPSGEPSSVFVQNGKLTKMFRRSSGAFGPDHTRVGAVAAIEERIVDGADGLVIEHVAHVVHNPFATVRISEQVFRPYPQLVPRGVGMVWTDRA